MSFDVNDAFGGVCMYVYVGEYVHIDVCDYGLSKSINKDNVVIMI